MMMAMPGAPKALRAIDAAVLEALVLAPLLGLDGDQFLTTDQVRYVRGLETATALVDSGEAGSAKRRWPRLPRQRRSSPPGARNSTIPAISADVSYKYYERDWKRIPEFENEPVIASGTLKPPLISIRPRQRNEEFAIEYSGNLVRSGRRRLHLQDGGGGWLSI